LLDSQNVERSLQPESIDVAYRRSLMVHLNRPVDAMRVIHRNWGGRFTRNYCGSLPNAPVRWKEARDIGLGQKLI
jgi:hypothetical protein